MVIVVWPIWYYDRFYYDGEHAIKVLYEKSRKLAKVVENNYYLDGYYL